MTDPEIDLESLIERIRGEVAQRRILDQNPHSSQPHQTERKISSTNNPRFVIETITLPRLPETTGNMKYDDGYKVTDFLIYHDKDFVRNAFRGILRREVDESGLTHYLSSLRNGKLSKLDILGRLRYSAEGKKHKVPVSGLLPRFVLKTMFHIPVVGYLLRLSSFLFRLPLVIQNWQRFESFVIQHQREQSAQFNRLAEQTETWINDNQQRTITVTERIANETAQNNVAEALIQKADVNQVNDLASQLTDGLEHKADVNQLNNLASQLTDGLEHKADVNQLNNLASQLTDGLEQKADSSPLDAEIKELNQQLLDLKRNILDQQRNLARIMEERRKARPEPSLEKQITTITSKVSSLTSQLADSLEQKADVNHVSRLTTQLADELEQKANVTQVSSLATQLADELEQKADVTQVSSLATQLADELEQKAESSEENQLLSAFYASFQDQFRGTREDIKKRVEVYLPIVKKAKVGKKKSSILDIGCGRGEWLEVLKENNLNAKGIDLNHITIAQCQEIKLDVIEANAIPYIQGLKDNSLGAVTGLHIIEHIPFTQLITLFDEILRVLKPGGVVIFETPNPENLVVGACNFYLDPTHLNPLPATTIKFAAEARGFTQVRVEYLNRELVLNPFDDLPQPGSTNDEITTVKSILDDYFYSAPDYSIIAYK